MKHHLLAAGVFAVAALSMTAQAQQGAAVEALDGVDPVLLIQGQEVSGKPDLKVVRGKFTYLFATPESKATFERDPARYKIQMDGACARMGPGVSGNPSDFAVVDGKIYIFGSDDCHKRFVAAPAKFMPRPVPAMPDGATALADGRALVERAVAALGGAEKLDAIKTYAEEITQEQVRGTMTVSVSTNTTWRFPGDIRSERTMAMQGRSQTSAMLVTADGAWYIGGPDRVFPQNPTARLTSEMEYGRTLVPLLRTRKGPDFKAAALGRQTVAGKPVDRVRIQNAFVDVTLGIDPASGRVQSLSFTGRNAEAEIGDYTLVYDDYRQTGGLLLPYDIRAIFDGAPDSFRTARIDNIAIDQVVDPALFAVPKGDGK